VQFAKQFWKIIGGSILLAWVAATFFPTVWVLFEGFWLTIKPEQYKPGSEALAQMDLATSTLASIIAFWTFVFVLVFGIVFGIILTCYEWIRYKRFPLLPSDKVDRLRADTDKRFCQIEQDISDIKKAQRVKRVRRV
jgi:MFS superfamily sulfate permease-like transporter